MSFLQAWSWNRPLPLKVLVREVFGVAFSQRNTSPGT